ncbi:MMPL family transporter [Nitrospira defluvii]|nr:MMPL family transporter [Nitrospira defluvii]
MNQAYFKFIVKHAYGVMGLITAITLFCFTQIASIQTEIDPKQILPQEHPFIETNTKIETLFGGGRVIVVGVVSKKGNIFTPTLLSKIDRMTQEIKSIPGIYSDNVLSIASRRVKHLRFNDQGFDVERLMPGIPRTQAEADILKEKVFSNPLYIGALVSPDASAAAIVIDVQDKDVVRKSGEISGEPMGEVLSDLEIHEALYDIVEKETDRNTSIHLGGLPISLAFLEKDTALMNRWIFPIAFILIMLIHYRAFRTFQGMLIPALTALLSVVWAMGMVSLLGMKLDLWTKGLTPILIVAMAAGHSVQILRRFYEALDYAIGTDIPEPAQKIAVVEATSKMAPVVLTSGFVAAASFASLISFQLPTFRSFGLMTAFGILSALILEMTLIPALRSLIPPPSGEELKTVLQEGRSTQFLSAIGRWVLGPQQRWIIFGGILMILVPFIFIGRIHFANSLRDLFFDRTTLRQDDKVLNEKFGGTSTLNILVTTKEKGGLKNPQVMRAVEATQALLRAHPLVGRSESYVDYIKRMRRSFYGNDPEEEHIPETREEAAQFLFLYSVSGHPDDFKRMVDISFQNAVITTFLKSDATELAEELIVKIDRLHETVFPPDVKLSIAGSVPVTLALNEVIIRGKLLNILQMVGICFVLVSIIFRSLLAGFFVLIPLILSITWNFGFLGLSGMPLGISTAAVSAMAVGMGADYAIYILYRFRDELSVNRHLDRVVQTTLQTAGKAILTTAVAFAAGTFLLAFPGYYLHIEGVLMPIAMLTSALSAIILLPTLVMVFRPHFIFRVIPNEWIELYERGESQKFNLEGDLLRKRRRD